MSAAKPSPPASTRRGFLGRTLAAAAGVAALAWGVGRRGRALLGGRGGPRERELGEADLRGPHDLAG